MSRGRRVDDDHDPVADPGGLGLTSEEVGEGSGSRWQWLAAAVLVVFLAAVVYAVVDGTARDERAARGGPADWTPLSGPSTSDVGGATVYTRCLGYNRLVVVVGPDGAPNGPATVITHEQSSGCDP